MRTILKFLTIGMALWTLTGFLGPVFWLFDLVNHFTMQAALILTGLTALLALTRQWRWALTAGLLMIVHLAQVVPLYLPATPTVTGQKVARIRVLQYNVHYTAKDQAPLAEYVKRIRPDFIALEEFTETNRAALEKQAIMKRYPYRVLGGVEIGLYSRFPLRKLPITLYKTVAVETQVHGEAIRFIAIHPPVPVFWRHGQQKDIFTKLIASQAKYRSSLIVLGDFNTTPWAPNFQYLTEGMHLNNSMQGFGVQRSWPTIGVPLIPIDHCLYRGNLVVTQREIGPALGSDHLPVLTTLDIYSND